MHIFIAAAFTIAIAWLLCVVRLTRTPEQNFWSNTAVAYYLISFRTTISSHLEQFSCGHFQLDKAERKATRESCETYGASAL